jgi:choline-sulfatase
MYEESVAIPFIISGSDIPQGKIVNTPISLVDCYPTILEAVNCPKTDATLPGESLWEILNEADHDRIVLSEYHAVGSQNGYYMLRDRQYKFVYYVDAPPQLFNLDTDPQELHNLAEKEPALVDKYEKNLRAILDPEAVNQQAKNDQASLLAKHGGYEAVVGKGYFQNSPVPGEKPTIRK